MTECSVFIHMSSQQEWLWHFSPRRSQLHTFVHTAAYICPYIGHTHNYENKKSVAPIKGVERTWHTFETGTNEIQIPFQQQICV